MFSLEVLLKNCVFARGFAENGLKSASWEHFARGSRPWAKIAQNRSPGSCLAEAPGPGPKLLNIELLGVVSAQGHEICKNSSQESDVRGLAHVFCGKPRGIVQLN